MLADPSMTGLLTNYEILGCEPLHDLKNHIENLCLLMKKVILNKSVPFCDKINNILFCDKNLCLLIKLETMLY